MTRLGRWTCGALGLAWLMLIGAAPAWAAGSNVSPRVFWASDPVRSGEAVLVTGDGLTADDAVELFRLADGPAGQPQPVQWPEKFIKPEVLQPRGQGSGTRESSDDRSLTTSATDCAATVTLSGPHSATLAARGDGYNLTVDLPRELPAGEY